MFRKLLKKTKRKKVFLKKGDHVNRDWATALLVFLIAILVVVAISIFIFAQVNSAEGPTAEQIGNGDLIDQELLDKTLEYYSEKKELFSRYQNEVPSAPEL